METSPITRLAPSLIEGTRLFPCLGPYLGEFQIAEIQYQASSVSSIWSGWSGAHREAPRLSCTGGGPSHAAVVGLHCLLTLRVLQY